MSDHNRGPQVEELDDKLEENFFRGQWDIIRAAHNPPPGPAPKKWAWDEVKSAIDDVKEQVGVEDLSVEMRRHIELINPVLRDLPSPSATSKTLSVGVQIVEPGETAPAHRHSIAAYRFGIQGNNNVITTVNGKEFPVAPGDLVLTPRMTWHEHVNNSDSDAIWIDGLDGPLMGAGLSAAFAEVPDEHSEDIEFRMPDNSFGPLRPVGESTYENPASNDSSIGYPPTPPYRYAWEDMYEILSNAREHDYAFDPYNGTYMEYVNPSTGAPPTLETLSLRLQYVENEQTQEHRHNSTEIYHVVTGNGSTEVGETTLEWEEGDFFMVPPGEWHSHNSSDDETILFVTSDQPIFEAFNVHQIETR